MTIVALAVVLLAAPAFLAWLIGIDAEAATAVLIRRQAAFLFGAGVTLWAARDAALSPARQAIALGVSVSMLGLAVLGAVEFLRGEAHATIGVAILVEIALGVAFLRDWLAHREER
ncbi:MAG: hypothetical protein AAGK21_13815 [Bacteroidota bacterium]